MSRITGNYIVTNENKTMVAWYDSGKFFIAGSHIPYTSSDFNTISEDPLDLSVLTENQLKATIW